MLCTENLYDIQLELEAEMSSLGVRAYRERLATNVEHGMETNSPPMRRLLDLAIRDTSTKIDEFLATSKKGAGRRHLAAPILEKLPTDALAFITAGSILGDFTVPVPMTKLCGAIGRRVESEIRFNELREQEPGLYKIATRKLSAVSKSVYYRTNALRRLTNKLENDLTMLTQNERTNLGAKLLECFIAATGFVQVTTVRNRKKTQKIIKPSPQTIEWLDTENARHELFQPWTLPMVVPPLDWTTPHSGGYLTTAVLQYPLVRTRNRAYLKRLHDIPIPEVYAAVNAVQATAWRVNRRVLAVMEEIWEKQLDLGVLPAANDEDYPPRPDAIPRDVAIGDLSEEHSAMLSGWRRAIRTVRDGNVRLVGKRVALVRTLWTARKYRDFEEIFFPHNLDFRGRLYPLPVGLQPQGDDRQRGLLEFANGVPITDDWAETWFLAYGAGCWGIDKVSLEERAEWVMLNHQAIVASASDPLANRYWLEADKPWQALAFAMDYAGYMEHGGKGYVSHLPIQMDGSCNGLQNFSAILRDAEGGASVNLTPANKPADIYTEVADRVNERVRRDAQEGNDIALGWIGRINRKVVKRPVMTLPYGATKRGYLQQILDDTVNPMKRSGDFPFENTWGPAHYLAGVIWDTVGEVVVAARQAMDWIQECAVIAGHAGVPLRWTTPAGLPVLQDYREYKRTKIKLTFDNKLLYLNQVSDDVRLNKRAQRNGSSPNIIHSLDACHLMKTVNSCAKLGIESFSLIHDSYGTHAGNAMVMATVLREEFVKMYTEHEVLDEFRTTLLGDLPDGTELPPVPPKGTLDLTLVEHSPYFFA